jgi:hypothetical protein
MSASSVESRIEDQLMPAMRIVGLLLFFLLMAGCVGVERTPPQTGAPQGEAVAVEPSVTNSTDQSVAKTDSPDAKTPAKIPASPVPAEQTRKKESATPGIGKQEALPPLDLATLEKRLRETNAIGVFTKITLKNQVDDLLNQFREYYQGRIKTTLAELRQSYDMLLLKVLSLLQDGDPSLARVIVASREAIWSILADPAKFATL